MIQQMLFYTMFFSAASTDLRPEGWECDLFPDGKTCMEYVGFNRTYCYRLEQRKKLYNAQYDPRYSEIQKMIDEANWLSNVWDTLYWAHMNASKYSITTRRDYLKKLRDLIGEEQFYQHQMPPPIPVGQFVEIEW